MTRAAVLLAALALGLASCSGGGASSAGLADLSGEGWYSGFHAIEGGPYSCRAEITGNTYRSASGELAAGRARIRISGSGLAWATRQTPRGELRYPGGELHLIDERAAAASGAGRFAAREGDVYVLVSDVEERARWSLSCEPDAAP